MREREKLRRERVKKGGSKQISVWLDADTYQALQALIQAQTLRGMGEAIRLLVDNHQAAQNAPQAASEPESTGKDQSRKQEIRKEDRCGAFSSFEFPVSSFSG